MNSEINIPELLELLSCPVCAGIMRKPHIFSDCKHIFCKTCVVQEISEKNCCPVCSKSVSKLFLVSEFENLISILFPDLAEKDKENEILLHYVASEKGFSFEDSAKFEQKLSEIRKNKILLKLEPFQGANKPLPQLKENVVQIELTQTVLDVKAHVSASLEGESVDSIAILNTKNRELSNEKLIKDIHLNIFTDLKLFYSKNNLN